MIENEVKILEINKKSVVAKLIELGAKKIFDDKICQVCFDTPQKTLRTNGKTLRLRLQGQGSVITYKKEVPSSRTKRKIEHEIAISDFKKMEYLLVKIGFRPSEIRHKRRISYKLADAHFDIDKYLDKYAHVPEFIEIESAKLSTIHKYAKILGYTEQDCLPWGADRLFRHYRNRRGS